MINIKMIEYECAGQEICPGNAGLDISVVVETAGLGLETGLETGNAWSWSWSRDLGSWS